MSLQICKNWLKAYFLYELETDPAKKNPEPVKNGPAPQHCMVGIHSTHLRGGIP